MSTEYSVVGHHLFPPFNLAIHVPGTIVRSKIDIIRKTDVTYLDEIRKAGGLYVAVWRTLQSCYPSRPSASCGAAALMTSSAPWKAITLTDGMTADYCHFDHDFLARNTPRFINEARGINRMVYDFTSNPPETNEWE